MHNPSSSYPQIVMLVLSLFTLHPLLHDNKPVYRLQQQSIRRLAFVPPYSVFCSISFRCGGLSIERNQKPLAPEITLAVTHHDRQKQVEVKRSSRVNPHEIRLFSGCPYYFTLPFTCNNVQSPYIRFLGHSSQHKERIGSLCLSAGCHPTLMVEISSCAAFLPPKKISRSFFG